MGRGGCVLPYPLDLPQYPYTIKNHPPGVALRPEFFPLLQGCRSPFVGVRMQRLERNVTYLNMEVACLYTTFPLKKRLFCSADLFLKNSATTGFIPISQRKASLKQMEVLFAPFSEEERPIVLYGMQEQQGPNTAGQQVGTHLSTGEPGVSLFLKTCCESDSLRNRRGEPKFPCLQTCLNLDS